MVPAPPFYAVDDRYVDAHPPPLSATMMPTAESATGTTAMGRPILLSPSPRDIHCNDPNARHASPARLHVYITDCDSGPRNYDGCPRKHDRFHFGVATYCDWDAHVRVLPEWLRPGMYEGPQRLPSNVAYADSDRRRYLTEIPGFSPMSDWVFNWDELSSDNKRAAHNAVRVLYPESDFG